MTNLQYSIESSSIPFALDDELLSIVENAIPQALWDTVNKANTHQESVQAFDVITDYISNNWQTILLPHGYKVNA